ncbi:biotin transporter BioY [Salidesulfovibrio onnuriiensis]|uniref:biotin transporter BioY n=1 Tax=Salidesulfovibrio onnuriiensis TaxID=2583823 RepID=UPI00202B7EFF|nr:biotin transporter BioY [Salidesulfovibrio onnuriiensis]
MNTKLASMHRLVWVSLMAAMTAASAFMVIPVGAVPFTMQPFFVFLAGFLLGPVHGLFALGLYLAAGILGLPVFSGGGTGIGHLFGPTGGYLIAFCLSALITGQANREKTGPILWLSGLFWGIVAIAFIYAVGAAWLKFSLGISWGESLILGVIPFAPWDQLKLIAAVACCRYLQKHGLAPSI